LNVKFASASSSEIKGEGEGFEAVIYFESVEETIEC
jgi:hypothetical protein